MSAGYEDLQDRWYVIARASEVGRRKPVRLRRFGEFIVLWRDTAGEVAGLPDRCPHRGMALSRGRIRDGHIECPFHGMRFDGTGQCTLIPAHGDDPKVARGYCTRHLVVREAYRWIWMWRGEPRESYPDIPYFDEIGPDEPEQTFSQIWRTNYLRVIENQLDFAHLPFVHHNTIGKGIAENNALSVHTEADGDRILTWMDDPRRPPTEGLPESYMRFLAPHIWLYVPRAQFFLICVNVPVDEETTLMYNRAQQKRVRIPVLAWLTRTIFNVVNYRVGIQDRAVIEHSTPPRPSPDVPEKLLPWDGPILALRRLLLREARERQRARPQPPDA